MTKLSISNRCTLFSHFRDGFEAAINDKQHEAAYGKMCHFYNSAEALALLTDDDPVLLENTQSAELGVYVLPEGDDYKVIMSCVDTLGREIAKYFDKLTAQLYVQDGVTGVCGSLSPLSQSSLDAACRSFEDLNGVVATRLVIGPAMVATAKELSHNLEVVCNRYLSAEKFYIVSSDDLDIACVLQDDIILTDGLNDHGRRFIKAELKYKVGHMLTLRSRFGKSH